jgi:hypothetical protein
MKKLLAVSTVTALITVLAIGAIAYAHCQVYSGHGYGHMYGWTGYDDQTFLDETVDLRKELNDKEFELAEAMRNPETDEMTITKLEKEITDLQDKVYARAPRTAGDSEYERWQ